MQYRDYIKTVYHIYRECRIKTFPIDCFAILNHYGFRVFTYSELKEINPELYELCASYSNDALHYRRAHIIAYNEKTALGRIRFSLMHELAHHIFKHSGECLQNEREADLFAITILAPPQAIVRSGCQTAEAVHNTFAISYTAANRALQDCKTWLVFSKKTELDFQLGDWFYPRRKSSEDSLPDSPSGDLSSADLSSVNLPPAHSFPFKEEEPSDLPENLPSSRTCRKKSSSIRRQKREREEARERISFFLSSDPDHFFRESERYWLYGRDL